ncbi:MAG: hypothetical protein AB7V04_12725 [Desulfomonilaceae bacterium]
MRPFVVVVFVAFVLTGCSNLRSYVNSDHREIPAKTKKLVGESGGSRGSVSSKLPKLNESERLKVSHPTNFEVDQFDQL